MIIKILIQFQNIKQMSAKKIQKLFFTIIFLQCLLSLYKFGKNQSLEIDSIYSQKEPFFIFLLKTDQHQFFSQIIPYSTLFQKFTIFFKLVNLKLFLNPKEQLINNCLPIVESLFGLLGDIRSDHIQQNNTSMLRYFYNKEKINFLYTKLDIFMSEYEKKVRQHEPLLITAKFLKQYIKKGMYQYNRKTYELIKLEFQYGKEIEENEINSLKIFKMFQMFYNQQFQNSEYFLQIHELANLGVIFDNLYKIFLGYSFEEEGVFYELLYNFFKMCYNMKIQKIDGQKSTRIKLKKEFIYSYIISLQKIMLNNEIMSAFKSMNIYDKLLALWQGIQDQMKNQNIFKIQHFYQQPLYVEQLGLSVFSISEQYQKIFFEFILDQEDQFSIYNKFNFSTFLNTARYSLQLFSNSMIFFNIDEDICMLFKQQYTLLKNILKEAKVSFENDNQEKKILYPFEQMDYFSQNTKQIIRYLNQRQIEQNTNCPQQALYLPEMMLKYLIKIMNLQLTKIGQNYFEDISLNFLELNDVIDQKNIFINRSIQTKDLFIELQNLMKNLFKNNNYIIFMYNTFQPIKQKNQLVPRKRKQNKTSQKQQKIIIVLVEIVNYQYCLTYIQNWYKMSKRQNKCMIL